MKSPRSGGTNISITIQDVILYQPAAHYCYGNVPATYSTSANTLTIAGSVTLTGSPSGTCTIDPAGVVLNVTPTGLLTSP